MLFSFFQKLATRWRYGLGFSLVVLVLIVALSGGDRAPTPQSFNPVEQPVKQEVRGVWITNVASSVLFAPWGIPRALNQLADMHFNTVYPVVWNRGQTFYRSQSLSAITGQPIAPLMALTHLIEDPLAEMVRVGHRQNLRVLPWFEYGFMVPMNSAIALQHPNWLTARQDGSRQLQSGLFEPIETPLERGLFSRLLNGGAPTQLGWLNPMHPSVQGLLLGLIEEVIDQYDVDGIQLDDHFSLPVEFGYDPYTVSLYQADHQGQPPPNNPADPDWLRWRAEKLSRFMNIIHARVKAKCLSCTISISPNPAKFAYRFYLQDWRKWVAEGWVDELVVQVYRDDAERFESELGKAPLQEAQSRIPVSIGILTGTWQHPISFEQIRQQVQSSRDRHFSGVSFFYWDTLWSYFTPESPQRRRQAFKQLMNEIS
ncbi:MAG: family 10 glycosylhydrolase [Phormidesmis sp.]